MAQSNQTVMRLFVLVVVFILLFGGAAVYAALQTKNAKAELETVKQELQECKAENERLKTIE